MQALIIKLITNINIEIKCKRKQQIKQHFYCNNSRNNNQRLNHASILWAVTGSQTALLPSFGR